MKHLIKFNEHVYAKAAETKSKSWMDNFTKLFKYLKNQIGNRQVKDFKKSGDKFTFDIMGRNYELNKNKNTITLFTKTKDKVFPVNLDLSSDQVKEIIELLKKPLKSPKAEEQGRKPYLDN